MSNGGSTKVRDPRLSERLQLNLERLERVKQLVPVTNEDLEKAIEALREDLEFIEVCFPHIYGPPPKLDK